MGAKNVSQSFFFLIKTRLCRYSENDPLRTDKRRRWFRRKYACFVTDTSILFKKNFTIKYDWDTARNETLRGGPKRKCTLFADRRYTANVNKALVSKILKIENFVWSKTTKKKRKSISSSLLEIFVLRDTLSRLFVRENAENWAV